ncbi:helix-turn-helix domain-containing protein [Deinococcus sp. QL22]|uniref:helix-turn-helix domain-containing protein n=1 Tax=Deinococcus sp. QL22 TaxID=2939437 RepID=UPI002017E102|nr:helix-turn-helix domain-containing protein [Deinococcus sp. QL22]UQN09189.1 helix-turn-helix domain-containing protein [Deinococcus sp. QL22]
MPNPAPDESELFVERLVRLGLLRFEPMVEVILKGELDGRPSTTRTVQRRFLQATGLSHRAVMSIDRAQRALALLEAGVAIPDVIYELEFADQPHLTKSLQRLIGRTPARVAKEAWRHAPLTSRERTRSELMPK